MKNTEYLIHRKLAAYAKAAAPDCWANIRKELQKNQRMSLQSLPVKSSGKSGWKLRATAAAAAVIIVAAGAGTAWLYGSHSWNPRRASVPSGKAEFLEIAKPIYPAATKYGSLVQPEQGDMLSGSFTDAVSSFACKSASKILTQQKEENKIYSPVSLFMSLSLAANGANGDTRDEILNALSVKQLGMENVSQQTGALFRNFYTSNEIGKLQFADSLWLNRNINFNRNFLLNASKNYYAGSYQVNFSSPDANKRIGEWISENTGGKLGNGFSGTDSNTAMALINTVYFYDQWKCEFNEKQTAKNSFYCADGNTVSCDFMNSTIMSNFTKFKNCVMTSLSFKNNAQMAVILPNQGVSTSDLLKDASLFKEAINPQLSSEDAEIEFSMPKFKYHQDIDLKKSLQSLGIKKAFKNADFSNLSQTPLFISKVKQSSCISVDEKGCEAAAFTLINMDTGGDEPRQKEKIVLNRPFIYMIMKQGVPLFIGVVANPND